MCAHTAMVRSLKVTNQDRRDEHVLGAQGRASVRVCACRVVSVLEHWTSMFSVDVSCCKRDSTEGKYRLRLAYLAVDASNALTPVLLRTRTCCRSCRAPSLSLRR